MSRVSAQVMSKISMQVLASVCVGISPIELCPEYF